MENGDTWIGRARVGVVRVEGDDRVDLLNRLSTNDVRGLAVPGRVVSTIFTTNKGRVVDWVRLIARASDLLIITSPGRGARVRDWIETYTIVEDVTGHDESEQWQQVVVHGPGAVEVAGLTNSPGNDVTVRSHGIWMRGLDAYGPRLEALVHAPADALVAELVDRGGVPAGEDDLELLRLRAGVPASHREFETEVNPLELRLAAHAINFDKGCFVGQEVLARMDSYDKVARVLMGFECEQSLPEQIPLKLQGGGRQLGRVTSVCNVAGGALGLGVVKREAAVDGVVAAVVGDAQVPVRLRDRPFWA